MLLMSAVFSAVLLIVVNVFAFRRQRPIAQRRSICMAIAIGCAGLLFCLLPAIAIHGVCLAVAVGLSAPGGWQPVVIRTAFVRSHAARLWNCRVARLAAGSRICPLEFPLPV